MAYIYGTSGPDTLTGTSSPDNIYGFGGNDLINGRDGDDFLFGGYGNDTLIGSVGTNDYWGGPGADHFAQSSRPGAGYNDDLIHDFTYTVDQIDVSAWGVSDISQMRALWYVGGAGNVVLNAYYGGNDHILRIAHVSPGKLAASDFIFSNSGAVNEVGSGDDDVLFGSRFADTIDGSKGSDVLLGGRGGDHISGSKGFDVLIGGKGRDILTGGLGSDTFVYNNPAESKVGNSRDHITDFTHTQDLIDVSGIDANSTIAGNQRFHFIGADPFSGTAGDLRAHATAAGDNIVAGDVNGDGHADFQIQVLGVDHLQMWDFIL